MPKLPRRNINPVLGSGISCDLSLSMLFNGTPPAVLCLSGNLGELLSVFEVGAIIPDFCLPLGLFPHFAGVLIQQLSVKDELTMNCFDSFGDSA